MNFLDHTLPETTQHYLDALAHISSKQAQQNDLMEKVKAHNIFLASQIAALTTHSAEQVNWVKKSQMQIDTLLQRVTLLEGNLVSVSQMQETTGAVVHEILGKTVASAQMLKDAVMSLEARTLAPTQVLQNLGKGLKPKTETLMADRYRDNGDGTVTDVTTGLEWMRFALGQKWRAGKCVGDAEEYTWDDANDAVEALNEETGYAGRRDWRLPSKKELLSLVYCSSGEPKTWNNTGEQCEGDYESPTIFQPAFPNTLLSSEFWSGSPYAGDSDGAWVVSFGDGSAYGYNRANDALVRLVRGG